MPNTHFPTLSGALPAWLPTASDAARTILHTVTRALDGMRADVEGELVEHVFSVRRDGRGVRNASPRRMPHETSLVLASLVLTPFGAPSAHKGGAEARLPPP